MSFLRTIYLLCKWEIVSFFLVHSSKMMFFFFTDICCWIMELIKPSLILDAATLKLNLPKAGAGLMELLWNWHNDEKVFETRNINILSQVDAGTSTDAATLTEPEWLGPCEPGTAVNLEGIVWHETDAGRIFNPMSITKIVKYSIFASLMGWVLQAICLLGGIDLTWGMGIDLSWAVI